jgi:DNA-binding transcriptional regulator YdaS (Cro superfamily)
MNKSDVSIRIHLAVRRYGNQRTMAKAMGCSEQYLSDMLRGTREWSEDLLAHVGVERYTAYEDCGKPKWMK